MNAYLFRVALAADEWLASLRARLAREEGQALVEYALILFMVALVCIAVLTTLGTKVSAVLQDIVAGL